MTNYRWSESRLVNYRYDKWNIGARRQAFSHVGVTHDNIKFI